MQHLKQFIKKYSVAVRIGVLATAVVCTTLLLSQTVFAKNTFVITDGDQVKVHTTYSTDPTEVLNEAGVKLGESDIVHTKPGADGTEITVTRGMNVKVDYCGTERNFVSYGETVRELFQRNGIVLTEDSGVDASLDAQVRDGMKITVTRTVTTTDSYTVSVPFETVYQETDLLKKGTEVVLTEGKAGQMVCSAQVTYINGLEADRQILTEEVTSEPVTRVIAVGTGNGTKKNGKPIIGDGVIIAGNGDVLTFTHRDTFKATSYCRTCEGGEITATGTVTRVGAIAVDPKVIPYGTRMFIVTKDGKYVYGVATAEDCGGSIKGKRLDLFYETRAEALEFGIRDCDVYFLG